MYYSPTDYTDCYRYYILAFHAHEEPAATQEACAAILEKAKLENWAMGKTKVLYALNDLFAESILTCQQQAFILACNQVSYDLSIFILTNESGN